MTEIPEHLLKRSRDRRAALGLGGDTGDEGTAETPAATPATTAPAATPAAATPAAPAGRKAAAVPAAAPPPRPDPPYVAAAKRRAKIPFWAMAALSLMPIWVFMYVRSLTEPPEVAEGPLGVGAQVFSGSCSSCHGADGAGSSSARQLNDGEVDKTFPHIEDQIRFVSFGTEQYNIAGVDIYGSPDREGGPHRTGSLGIMPGWSGELSDTQILAAVCEERYGLPGAADPTSDEWAEEFEHWCADESPIYAAVEAGTALADLDTAGITDADGNPIEIRDIGTAPAPGSS